MEQVRMGAVVMAAGSGTRFGSNKLLAEFGGRSLIRRALEAVPADCAAAVVTQYDEVAVLAAEMGFSVLRNPHPDWGVSHTVRLGTEFLAPRCDGIVFLVADQPLLRRETVERLIAAFRAEPDRIVVPVAADRRGNPCVFPSDLFPALAALSGDRGGRQVIRANPGRVLELAVPAQELYDIDSVSSLHELEQADAAYR